MSKEIKFESGAIYKPIDATTIDTSSITDFKISRLTEHEKIDLIKNQYNQIQENLIKLKKYDSLIDKLDASEPTTIEIIWWLIKSSPIIIKLIYYILKLINLFQNKKV